MSGEVLGREAIKAMLGEAQPLLEEFLSLDDQLQPNGFDLTLREVSRLTSSGSMGQDSKQREISATEPLNPDDDGWIELSPGPYLITFNEVVALPLDLMALGRSRSSLLRSGVSIHTAVWDAGYQGRSQAFMVVHHPQGYRVQIGARVMQLVFLRLGQPVVQGYQGNYLRENLD